MEGEGELEVITSLDFLKDLHEVFLYGREEFGEQQALSYEKRIWSLVSSLATQYEMYPEVRFLRTKSRSYRWVILEAHRLIYRIAPPNIQVLRLIHARKSIREIKAVRSVKP